MLLASPCFLAAYWCMATTEAVGLGLGVDRGGQDVPIIGVGESSWSIRCS
ncbi:MAG: hypothetical protein ACK5O2_16640 [Microthrixaceae bacterium]